MKISTMKTMPVPITAQGRFAGENWFFRLSCRFLAIFFLIDKSGQGSFSLQLPILKPNHHRATVVPRKFTMACWKTA
jgi:hypothetical protein